MHASLDSGHPRLRLVLTDAGEPRPHGCDQDIQATSRRVQPAPAMCHTEPSITNRACQALLSLTSKARLTFVVVFDATKNSSRECDVNSLYSFSLNLEPLLLARIQRHRSPYRHRQSIQHTRFRSYPYARWHKHSHSSNLFDQHILYTIEFSIIRDLVTLAF